MNPLLKYPLVVLSLVAYALTGWIVQNLPLQAHRRKRLCAETTTRYCRWGLRLLGIHVSHHGAPQPGTAASACIVVSNHLSYVDILVIAAQHPTLFVSSTEVERSPLLGFLARCGGTIFVDRRNPRNIHQEQQIIASWVEQGLRVCIFPEATTSDGSNVLPFRSGLLEIACQRHFTIQPLCLCYHTINSRQANQAELDVICYYGDMEFLAHVRRLLQTRSVHASMIFMEPVYSASGTRRKELSDNLHKRISSTYISARTEHASTLLP